jgi:RNA polymerase sigma-70 factor (ECF subfamily)
MTPPPDEVFADATEPLNLIALARTGDQSALGCLLEQFRPLLRGQARQSLDPRLQARVDQSDLAQMTLATAANAFSAFRGGSEPELVGWLQAILQQHVAAMVRLHLQAQKRGAGREQVLAGDGDLQAGWEPAARGSTPSRLLMREETRAQVDAALDQLPWEQREAVRLRFLDEWSTQQIAEFLGKTERSVAGLLWRGMSRLKEVLGDSL